MLRRSTRIRLLAVLATACTSIALAGPAKAGPATQHRDYTESAAAHNTHSPTAGRNIPFGCATAAARAVACLGWMRAHSATGRTGPQATSGAQGYGPADIQSAYGLGGTDAAGRTVAIVDAGDDPKAEADLATYRSNFGLPACTTANGCFRKINQNGATSPLPAADYGWAEETSLDLDMVSATCPSCKIVLVEGNSASEADLSAAEDTAAAQPGVVAISNSFGAPEPTDDSQYDSHFIHPGITVVASTGDTGNVVNWPSSMPSVTAVGGTSLKKDSSARGWAETVWSGAGSGCSKVETRQPAFQQGITACTTRSTADVAAVADPNTGVAIYDTAASCGTGVLCSLLIALGLAQGANGWVQVGGTSVSSPIVASIYALAGDGATNAKAYSAPAGSLNDVTSGSNGSCGTKECNGAVGYDGPTGMGTPHGLGAF